MKIIIDTKDFYIQFEGQSGKDFKKFENIEDVLSYLKKYFEDTKIAEQDSLK